jgi:hypothetical protein
LLLSPSSRGQQLEVQQELQQIQFAAQLGFGLERITSHSLWRYLLPDCLVIFHIFRGVQWLSHSSQLEVHFIER